MKGTPPPFTIQFYLQSQRKSSATPESIYSGCNRDEVKRDH